ncbi:MAG: hypothetical protein ABMA64_37760 [Myxococcota bacterium]
MKHPPLFREQLALFAPTREARPGEFGRCLCGRVTRPGEGMWGPPLVLVVDLTGELVRADLEESWLCRGHARRMWKEYSARVTRVQQYVADLGLKLRRP